MQEVTTGMREKGINNMELADREDWRINIKLQPQVQKVVQISRFYTKINNIYLCVRSPLTLERNSWYTLKIIKGNATETHCMKLVIPKVFDILGNQE